MSRPATRRLRPARLRAGALQPPLPAAAAARRRCGRSASSPTARSPGCGRRAVTRGWCHGHYLRWSRGGDVRADVPLAGPRATTAASRLLRTARVERRAVPGARPAAAAVRRPGRRPPTPPARPRAAAASATGTGCVRCPPSWRHLVPPGRTQGDGAPARHGAGARAPAADADETVHHRNGDRLDNRPENLELWSTAQPKGQRVEDKVAWAYALLARYDPRRGDLDLRPSTRRRAADARPGCRSRTTQSRRDWVVLT